MFTQLGALSRQERLRPFDRRADGILIGEGTGVVVLKRLADARRDGDRIYAVIRGTGVAGDGRSASLFNPEPAGQARAIRRAWSAAGLDPTTPDALGMIEAHGTGTPIGDLAELATLADVFGPAGAGDRAVIGTVKSMIGHTMPTAGVAGLVKAALAVHREVLLPTLHCEQPRPELDRTRFRPIAVAEPWESTGGPRRAGVNAFGFGGINAHVVIEQAPHGGSRRPARVRVDEPEAVLRLMAPDPAALLELLTGDDARVLARGLPAAAGGHGCRLAVVAPTAKRLALARRIAAEGQPWRGRSDVWFTPRPLLLGPSAGTVAFVFPGLEAGFTPRVADVAARLGASELAVDAGTVGRQGVGVFAVGRLLERALRRMGVTPDAVAGHSVGEWTAMVSAGLYSGAAADGFLTGFDPDEVQVPGLVFAAVGAGADRIGTAIAGLPRVVLSHDNAPHQCVVCGPEGDVADLVAALRGQGVVCQVLPFRSGFHTPMFAPYLGPVRAAAERFELHPPTVPVWSATAMAPFPTDPAAVRELFLRHLVEPVRFRGMVEAMYAAGVRAFVQVGTGQLHALIADVLAGRDHLAVAANTPQHTGLAQLLRVSVALWAEGAAPDPALLDGPRAADRSVGLDLGGALVSLGPLAASLVSSGGTASTDAAATGSGLDRLGDRGVLGAELAALLRETAESAVAVLDARTAGVSLAPVSPAAVSPAPVSLAAAPPVADRSTVLTVSVAAMPYLRDHCFFRQREGWPDDTDRRPVVPATTVLGHLLAAAEQSAPGRLAVAADNARFKSWVVAAPATQVPVTVTGAGPDRAAVTFGEHAEATVELATGYPDPPMPWPVAPAAERAPQIRAEQLYTDRWMFHGPRYQGVSRLVAISDDGARGVLTTPPAPGALLDNVGQLLGYWIMATHTTRRVVFPVGMGRIAFFGPHPAPGTELECVIRIRSITDSQLVADAQHPG